MVKKMFNYLRKLLFTAFYLTSLNGVAGPVHSDIMPLNQAALAPNFAEISVFENKVHVELELNFADLSVFQSGDVRTSLFSVPPTPEELARFTAAGFKVRADNGSPITPIIGTVDIRDRKPRPQTSAAGFSVALPQRSERAVYVELNYPLTDFPNKLTFAPPVGGDGSVLVTFGFLVEHKEVPVIDYRYLSVPETLTLDWDDPWYSAFENPNLTRHHKSALMSFLTVEPKEVRHEIIFRLRDLESWVNLDLGGTEVLTSNQIAVIKEEAANTFMAANPVVIDGTAAYAKSAKLVFLDVNVSGLRVLENPEGTSRDTALLGIVLSYPQPSLPDHIEMTWQLFPEGAPDVLIRVIDPAGGVPIRVASEDPVVVWKNFLVSWEDPVTAPIHIQDGSRMRIPLLTLFLAFCAAAIVFSTIRSSNKRWMLSGLAVVVGIGAVFASQISVVTLTSVFKGQPDKEVAISVVESILSNVGVSMLEPEPETLRLALSPFVPEENIDEIGNEIDRGLSVILPSGARARTDTIENLTIEEISLGDGRNQSRVLASWTARVSGGHWGHQHKRVVQYRGLLDLSRANGSWYLDGLTILNARVSI